MKTINREALFSDETMDYRCPCEPDPSDTVELIFRTKKEGADAVYCLECESGNKTRLTYADGDTLFDYYKIEITVSEDPVFYYFQVEKDEDACFYNRLGVIEREEAEKAAHKECAFRITPGFHVPEWVKGAVMYQIYVDRFCNGDLTNDTVSGEYHYIGRPVEKAESWEELPGILDVHRFYGGDIRGILDKLDYLESLEVEVIYLNPIFVSPSNHKYDCQDYDHVDPHLGSIVYDVEGGEWEDSGPVVHTRSLKYAVRTGDERNLRASDELFAHFVKSAHDRGIRVIIDGVFNHCGSFNKWLDAERLYEHTEGYPPGAYISKDSPYRDFFKFDNEDGWPYNDSYAGWWGHSTLPKLNYEESPKLCSYIRKVAGKWVSPPFNADGWRLDVAADLGRSAEFNHKFWQEFRKAVKEANPDAVILAEHYGDPSPWLKGDQWDTVMNYDAFMEPVSWFLTGMEKHSDECIEELYGNGAAFFDMMSRHMSRLQTPSLMAAMNELSNHDHSRFMTRTNRITGRLAHRGSRAASEGVSYGIFRQGVVIQMTWPGAPTIYYGDETGVCGWTDPDSRRTYPWGREDMELIEFHRYMTSIRRQNPALRNGSLKALAADYGLIAYGRFTKESRCVVAVNTLNESRMAQIPVWQIGVTDKEQMNRRMLTFEEGYNVGLLSCPVEDGSLKVELPARGAAVLII